MDIPTTTPTTIEKPNQGLAVYAVQRAVNELIVSDIAEDGDYGPITEGAVKKFQGDNSLSVDGRFGPATSEKMARKLSAKVTLELPPDLLRGFIQGESSNYIAAVNWSVAGGVDCGYVQRRIYEGSYGDEATKKRAFDSLYQLSLLGDRLVAWFQNYQGAGSHERRWRLSALRHNYEYAADRYAAGTWPSAYALSEQPWVVAIGAKFKDGTRVRTPDDWCHFYALGAPEHNDPGSVTRFVKEWP